jgi:chromosome segregation ATPase
MTKLATSLAVSAVLSIGAVGCKNEVGRKTQDVEDARQDLREEQQELEEVEHEKGREVDEARADLDEEKMDLEHTMANQLGDAERRYNELVQQLAEAKGDTIAEPGPGLERARTTAQDKLQAAKTAQTPEQTRMLLVEVEQALDHLEQEIDQFQDRA